METELGYSRIRNHPIDLGRTMAPVSANFAQHMKDGLTMLAHSRDLAQVMKSHRFLGTSEDKSAASDWIGRRLRSIPPEDRIIVTGGTQSTLLVLLPFAAGQQKTILTENLTYLAIRPLARLLGLQVVGVELDDDGILPDSLAKACRRTSARVLYTNPTVHNPTGRTMSLKRRKEIVAVVREHGVTVIEDDVQGVIVEDAPAAIADLAPERTWYIMSVTKSLAMGLRIAYVVAPTSTDLSDLIRPLRSVSSWYPSPLSAAVVAHWHQTGQTLEILHAIKAETVRRQAFVASILRGLDYYTNKHGLHLWLELPAQWPADLFVAECLASGVDIRAAGHFAVDGSNPNAVRISIGGPPTSQDLETGLNILVSVLQQRPRPAS
ncbi:PLP-dependent aminotransferase family protein [Sinorhizobium meliloti]|uniref:aminotransferase-like domain-containing protein n=1 Tax=Rhizobium meliloti TaxID=382 RepID=UPI000FDB14D4|nr:PLP-dependent aminotransferase family protein [Sinorhizobium meliloti]RVG26266.1 PLP-dependent aminotransferase family protein [Sinorhizobium meliloti]